MVQLKKVLIRTNEPRKPTFSRKGSIARIAIISAAINISKIKRGI